MSPAEVAGKSARIMEQFLDMDEYRRCNTIMFYVSFGNEVQTGELIIKALTGGKRVAVPATDVAGRRLTPSLLTDFPGDLQPGSWGIPEPRHQCLRPLDPGELDMVVVPGVAFATDGNRLGHGYGFYDRFLPRAKPGAVFIAPAFELQIKPNVYSDRHDIPVHYIITEERLIKCC